MRASGPRIPKLGAAPALGGCQRKLLSDTAAGQRLPAKAQCVVIGGGVIGSSVAYHLAKGGLTDIVLVEQHQVTSGTTWHAAGLVGMLRGTETETKLSMYGRELYTNLETETGLSTGFKQCGSVALARTPERFELFKRNKARGAAFGVPSELLTPEECGERMGGLITTSDLVGGLWLPLDGSADPTMVTNSMAKGARMNGAEICEGIEVTGFKTEGGRVSAVETSHGTIQTRYVVNCAGQWARQLGALAGVNIPLHSAEHFYITTQAIDTITPETPVMRDPDAYTYFREWSGGLLVGGFEPECKPVFSGGAPRDFAFSLLDFDWEQFQPLLDGALERVPALQETDVHTIVNGPESFTPDNQYIIGEAPNVDGFFVAAGMNSSGIASAAGVGKAVSQWIIDGTADRDLWSVDICRFGPFHGSIDFLRNRTVETLGLHYAMPWPGRELKTGRPLRRSALYDKLKSSHAVFGNKMGWERPNYYAASAEEATADPTFSWGRPCWYESQRREALHTRTAVSVFDQSSFGKFVVQGREAVAAMQQLCAGDVDTEIGQLTYTGMLNQWGGYEADVTVNRRGETEFLVVSGTSTAVRDLAWMRRNIAKLSLDATVTDVSGQYAVLGVMGPTARKLLSAAAPFDDFSDNAFPFGSSKVVGFGFAPVLASRVTYVGELGCELYTPVEFAAGVYEHLKSTAAEHDHELQDAGYYAIDSLRIEKAFRAWGHELSPMVTPAEAGLGFAVAYEKPGGFIGQAAAIAAKESKNIQRCVNFWLRDNPEVFLYGGETIVLDGVAVGYLSSASYAHSLGGAAGMGMIKSVDGVAAVDAAYVREGEFEVDYNGVRYPMQASLRPFFDPKSERTKG